MCILRGKMLHMLSDFVLVSGCRAEPGGLHLGHVYGCLQELPIGRSDLYFVIDDTCSPRVDPQSITDIAFDVLASRPKGVNVRVVRATRLQDVLQPLVREILWHTTWPQLRIGHPKIVSLRDNTYNDTLQDLLFPIRDSSRLIGLGCDIACYNDDNLRLVHFTTKLQRRIRKAMGVPEYHDTPRLRLREPGRLLSYDGTKMAKGRNNALLLSASPNEVSLFAKRMVQQQLSSRNQVADPDGPSDAELCIYKAFGSISDNEARQLRGKSRVDVLVETLESFLAPIQLAHNDFVMQGQSKLNRIFKTGEDEALTRIETVMRDLGLKGRH